MQSETWPLGFDQCLAELCVSLCTIKVGVGSDLQLINNNIQFWVFKRQRFVYRLRYRSSFHQNENFIEEIESLLASLENFTIKKKKKIDLAPLEIEASNEFSNLVSRRGFEAAESSGRVGSAFESLPLSMHLPLPPHSSQPAFPYPGERGPVSTSSCSQLTQCLVGGWARRPRPTGTDSTHTSFFLHLKYHKTGETRW